MFFWDTVFKIGGRLKSLVTRHRCCDGLGPCGMPLKSEPKISKNNTQDNHHYRERRELFKRIQEGGGGGPREKGSLEVFSGKNVSAVFLFFPLSKPNPFFFFLDATQRFFSSCSHHDCSRIRPFALDCWQQIIFHGCPLKSEPKISSCFYRRSY